MKQVVLLMLVLFCLISCATAPAKVVYNYNYDLDLWQGEGAKIGDVDVLLESKRESEINQTPGATAEHQISPTLSIPWGGR